MAEYAEKGLTLRWDVPDLFAAGSRAPCVVVAARPAHPSNAVTVAYTVNGGATRVARGHRMQREPRSDGEEWFAVDLPPQEDGALLTFVPILSCSGREADPRRGGFPPTPLVSSLPQPPAARATGAEPSPPGVSPPRTLRASPSSRSSCSGSPLSSNATRTRSARHRTVFA